MKLFIVRHGETEENLAGVLMGQLQGVLTEKGKDQARQTALVLKDNKFAHIYCSDLNRCVGTVEFIKEFHPDTPLTFTKELRERNLGVFQGQSHKAVDWEGLPGEHYDKKPENGESLSELKTRVLHFISELYKLHQNDDILLVSHNAWIKQVVAHFAGVPSKDLVNIDNAQIIQVLVGDNMTGSILKQ